MTARLLAGPALAAGPESLAAHRARLGLLPGARDRQADSSAMLEAPACSVAAGPASRSARKWAIGRRSGANGDAIVLANGAEGEPLSARRIATLMADSAAPRARWRGAGGRRRRRRARSSSTSGPSTRTAIAALARALAERRAEIRADRVADPGRPRRAAAVVRRRRGVRRGPLRQRGRRPADHDARRARSSAASTAARRSSRTSRASPMRRSSPASATGWYREAGRGETRGTALHHDRRRAAHAASSRSRSARRWPSVAALAGRPAPTGGPVLLGGYFGGWVAGDEPGACRSIPSTLRAAGPRSAAASWRSSATAAAASHATARILDFMAGQSAAQCGPCVFGLRAIADATARLAAGRARDDDSARLSGWSETARRPRRLPPSRRRRRPAAERAPRLRHDDFASAPAQRAGASAGSASAEGRLMPPTAADGRRRPRPTLVLAIDRIGCDGYGHAAPSCCPS